MLPALQIVTAALKRLYGMDVGTPWHSVISAWNDFVAREQGRMAGPSQASPSHSPALWRVYRAATAV